MDRNCRGIKLSNHQARGAPGCTSVPALEDARAEDYRIESGLTLGFDQQIRDPIVGQTSDAPALTSIRALEHAAVRCPRIERVWRHGVDRQSGDENIG